jgi:AcrR family transcriptional regulator
VNGYVYRMVRRYEQKERARQQAGTRERIVKAVVALHREVGPARTTISAIAARAGVERLTVYRHFADEASLFEACSAHFSAEVPPPNPAAWSAEPHPERRLSATLAAFYDYYRRGEDMLAHISRDAPVLPAIAGAMAPWLTFVAITQETLLDGWGAACDRRFLAGSVAHALRFETWQSLTHEGAFGDAEAIELMVALCRAAVKLDGRMRRMPTRAPDPST